MGPFEWVRSVVLSGLWMAILVVIYGIEFGLALVFGGSLVLFLAKTLVWALTGVWVDASMKLLWWLSSI